MPPPPLLGPDEYVVMVEQFVLRLFRQLVYSMTPRRFFLEGKFHTVRCMRRKLLLFVL